MPGRTGDRMEIGGQTERAPRDIEQFRLWMSYELSVHLGVCLRKDVYFIGCGTAITLLDSSLF